MELQEAGVVSSERGWHSTRVYLNSPSCSRQVCVPCLGEADGHDGHSEHCCTCGHCFISISVIYTNGLIVEVSLLFPQQGTAVVGSFPQRHTRILLIPICGSTVCNTGSHRMFPRSVRSHYANNDHRSGSELSPTLYLGLEEAGKEQRWVIRCKHFKYEYSHLPKGLSPAMHEHACVHYLIIIKHWNFLAMQWGKDSIFLLP